MSRQYWSTAAEWSLWMSLGQDSSHRSACSTTTHFKLRNIQSPFNVASWFAWLCSLFCRCALSAKKLEFMFICPTATVETQQKFSIAAVYSLHSSVHLHQCWSTVSFTFNLPRECPEDLHIKRFNELHESSTHFCHCSRRRDVYSAAEGKKNTWTVTASKHTNVFFSLLFTRVMCRRRNLQRTPPPSGYESGSHHRHLHVCRWSKCQRRNDSLEVWLRRIRASKVYASGFNQTVRYFQQSSSLL